MSEHGVGRRVVARRLIEPGDVFDQNEGVWFSTRVIGGREGSVIRHVWIHEGRHVQSITLEIGGPDWRTHSRKTLRDAGRWTVEAQDGRGRVLARTSFICLPAGRAGAGGGAGRGRS